MHKRLDQIDIVLLDAMGVIYAACDDVGELLIPFLREPGSQAAEPLIQEAYLQASLGQISARTFWSTLGLDPELEDIYLARHRLHADLIDFIHRIPQRQQLACLSNDVSEWSAKLRRKFSLEALIPQWIISGDVGYRKPDARIYDIAAAQLGLSPERILFIDDRLANVQAARAQGMHAVLFETGGTSSDEPTYTFAALMDLLGE